MKWSKNARRGLRRLIRRREEGAGNYFPYKSFRRLLRTKEGKDGLAANEVESTFVRGGSFSFNWKSINMKEFSASGFPFEGGARYEGIGSHR